MDKLAYYLNKRRQPVGTTGKILYYYPTNDVKSANVHVGNKHYITVEATEQEWEALVEMDRLEYNSTHAYQHRSNILRDEEADALFSPVERITNGGFDSYRRTSGALRYMDDLTERELQVYTLCVIEGKTQVRAAEELGLTQGYISITLKKAKEKVTSAELKKASPEAYIRKCWDEFLETGSMPDYLDVEIEFIIRYLGPDMLPFFQWYYSVGELCRDIMKFYLFGESTIDRDIARFLQTADPADRQHFEEYYMDKPTVIQAVFVRLFEEMKARQKAQAETPCGYTSIYALAEMLAPRLKMSAGDFLSKRFFPFFTKSRSKQIEQFYRAYSGKRPSA